MTLVWLRKILLIVFNFEWGFSWNIILSWICICDLVHCVSVFIVMCMLHRLGSKCRFWCWWLYYLTFNDAFSRLELYLVLIVVWLDILVARIASFMVQNKMLLFFYCLVLRYAHWCICESLIFKNWCYWLSVTNFWVFLAS